MTLHQVFQQSLKCPFPKYHHSSRLSPKSSTDDPQVLSKTTRSTANHILNSAVEYDTIYIYDSTERRWPWLSTKARDNQLSIIIIESSFSPTSHKIVQVKMNAKPPYFVRAVLHRSTGCSCMTNFVELYSIGCTWPLVYFSDPLLAKQLKQLHTTSLPPMGLFSKIYELGAAIFCFVSNLLTRFWGEKKKVLKYKMVFVFVFLNVRAPFIESW